MQKAVTASNDATRKKASKKTTVVKVQNPLQMSVESDEDDG